MQAQLGNPIGSFWYYAGHAIGSLIQNSKYEVFAKETIQQLSKSKDTLENKAVVDVLTELDPRKIDNKLLSWSLLQLENIVDLVNNRDKTNWHFKWSVTEAVEKVFTEFNSRLCFSILKKCVKGINGFEDNNQIIYDRVASAIFGLELSSDKKLNQNHTKDLVDLLQFFMQSGKDSTDVDTFYQVVAKYDTKALLDFIVKKITGNEKKKSTLDIVPFDWTFVFERIPDNLADKEKTEILEHIIHIVLSDKFIFPLGMHLDRIWAALQKKLSMELGYNVLNIALEKNTSVKSKVKLLYLLEEVEDYNNPQYWKILEKQIKTKNPQLVEQANNVIFAGSFNSAQEDYRKKWLTQWTKSYDIFLVNFAKQMLDFLKKLTS